MLDVNSSPAGFCSNVAGGRISVFCNFVGEGKLVPKGRLAIARRFNAGFTRSISQVPEGRLTGGARVGLIQPSLRDLIAAAPLPALKRRASLAGPFGTGHVPSFHRARN